VRFLVVCRRFLINTKVKATIRGALVDARHGNCGSDPDAIHVRSELGQLLRQIGLAPGPAISPAASTSLTRQTKSASSQTRPNLSSLG
jgi:hypothetical protein